MGQAALTAALDILIPHYRDPAGLRMSLTSIVAQDWDGFMRVVVIDDGSPEADRAMAMKICADFATETGIGMYFEANPRNLGRPGTRNRLLDLVAAEHVAWLDAGDVWYPEKLSRQFEHLGCLCHDGADPDRIWVTCPYDWQQEGRKPRSLIQRVEGDQVAALLEGDHLRAYLWTLLGTARAFGIAGRFDERLPRLQDLDYFLNFVHAGGRIATPPGDAPLCRYFKSNVGRSAADVHGSYRIILAKNRSVIQTYPPAMVSRLHYKADRLAARFAFSNRSYGAGLGYLARAVLRQPRHAARAICALAMRRLKGRGET